MSIVKSTIPGSTITHSAVQLLQLLMQRRFNHLVYLAVSPSYVYTPGQVSEASIYFSAIALVIL